MQTKQMRTSRSSITRNPWLLITLFRADNGLQQHLQEVHFGLGAECLVGAWQRVVHNAVGAGQALGQRQLQHLRGHACLRQHQAVPKCSPSHGCHPILLPNTQTCYAEILLLLMPALSATINWDR